MCIAVVYSCKLGGLDIKLKVCILVHTVCARIAMWMRSFAILFLQSPSLHEGFTTVLVTNVEITQQPDVHLLIDLFCYCR